MTTNPLQFVETLGDFLSGNRTPLGRPTGHHLIKGRQSDSQQAFKARFVHEVGMQVSLYWVVHVKGSRIGVKSKRKSEEEFSCIQD